MVPRPRHALTPHLFRSMHDTSSKLQGSQHAESAQNTFQFDCNCCTQCKSTDATLAKITSIATVSIPPDVLHLGCAPAALQYQQFANCCHSLTCAYVGASLKYNTSSTSCLSVTWVLSCGCCGLPKLRASASKQQLAPLTALSLLRQSHCCYVPHARCCTASCFPAVTSSWCINSALCSCAAAASQSPRCQLPCTAGAKLQRLPPCGAGINTQTTY